MVKQWFKWKQFAFGFGAVAAITLLCAFANAGYFTTVTASVGYEIAGAASTNHLLVGNGSQYVDAATLPSASLPNIGTPGTYATPFSMTIDAEGRITNVTTVVQDQFQTLNGCSFANDGGGLTCNAGSITWPAAFADTSYIVGCWTMFSSAIAGGSSTQPAIILNVTISSTTQATITEGVAQGSSGGFGVSSNYGVTIVCHAHHN